MENLQDLLRNDEKSKKYYMTLSEELQGGLALISDSIHSYEDIVSFVEKRLSK